MPGNLPQARVPKRLRPLLAACLAVASASCLPTPRPSARDAAGRGQDWPTLRGAASRCGCLDASRAPARPQLLWRFRETKLLERRPFTSSPALSGDRVVLGSDSYRVYCLDLRTGQPQWKFDARWPVFSSPAVWGGRVFVGEGLHEHTDCKLYCLDLASGKELWSLQTQSHTESSPTVADGKLYFGAGDDGVYCADPLTGKVLWQHKGPHVDCSPLVVGGRVYVGSGYGFQGVVCLSARDGTELWRKATPAPVWAAPSFADGRLYVAVSNSTFTEMAAKPVGEVRCLDPATGDDLWRFDGAKGGVLASVAVRDGRAVAACLDGACYCLDAKSGALLWRSEAGSPILCSPAVAADGVLFGTEEGRLVCLRLRDGAEAWSVDTSDDVLVYAPDPRILASPAVGRGCVVFGSSNGTAYCLGAGR